MRYMIGLILVFPLFAICDEAAKVAVTAVDPATAVVAGDEFFQFLIKSIGGTKGMKILGIVGVVSQIVMKALQTPLIGKWAGKWKYLSIYAFSLVGGVVGLMTVGELSFWPAMLHANTLAAFQSLGHQGYKQFVAKK